MARLSRISVRMVVADFFSQSGWGLIAPIFAIFITEQIEGGSIEIVAFAAATYWIVKSLVQPFLAIYLDTIKGEKDDFNFLVYGMYVAALIPLGYFFASQIWHVFALECIRGIAMACVVPTWHGIFTRHLNKGWEAFSWSIQSTSLGFAAGFAAAFGGVLASFMGFKVVFVLVCLSKLLSATILALTRNNLFLKERSEEPVSNN